LRKENCSQISKGALLKLFGTTPPPKPPQPATAFTTLRRSQRIWLTAAIRVSYNGRDQASWTEETSSIVANAHGALILVEHELATGQVLTIESIKTREVRTCRVVMFGATVADLQEVGIEFTEPSADFWGLSQPPGDWAPFSKSRVAG
jgi:hypothetical protein